MESWENCKQKSMDSLCNEIVRINVTFPYNQTKAASCVQLCNRKKKKQRVQANISFNHEEITNHCTYKKL